MGILRLVEGHTRLGTLRGLVEAGMVSKTVVHAVWVGKCIENAHASKAL
jgi:hypothetical protein